jgi:hypothetical protein
MPNELEEATRHANAGMETLINEKACGDLFKPKPTQQEIIYDFIKSRGRVKSHELNEYACIMRINNPGSRARELKAEGKIWRMSDHLRKCLYKDSKEEIWSTIEADKDQNEKL